MKNENEDRGALALAGGWTSVLSLLILWVALDVLMAAGSGPPDAFSFVSVNFILIPVLYAILFILTSVLVIRQMADRDWRGVDQTAVRLLCIAGMAWLIASGRIVLIMQMFLGRRGAIS